MPGTHLRPYPWVGESWSCEQPFGRRCVARARMVRVPPSSPFDVRWLRLWHRLRMHRRSAEGITHRMGYKKTTSRAVKQ
eukprot:scaffold141614_cov42-Tisochrysis_lutea.AAC.1